MHAEKQKEKTPQRLGCTLDLQTVRHVAGEIAQPEG